MKPKLLLHVCCACCSTAVIQQLKEDYDITLFFSDSNIYPVEEYKKRLENAKIIAKLLKLEIVEDEYNNNGWDKFVSKAGTNPPDYISRVSINQLNYISKTDTNIQDYKEMPEGGQRCNFCFKYNLTRTAEFAKHSHKPNHFEVFTTTLTVSPHKNHVVINKIGKLLEEKYGIRFLESNFKKQDGFRISTELSKKYNLYRQNYCGCRYSMRRK
ncbi:epoxyqueuosine reductase QueH [Candidatus Woesearchaeota archaeon]|nr:epoxyqueuosine reductase QueH [Candidatus Woesearchaeota archaeon]